MRKIQKYMIEAITGAFLLLFLFWTIGYFANALLGTKFDIRSCWDGFTTLGGAGVLAMVKYIMDSWKNDAEGPRQYAAGTWGPRASSAMIARDGYCWTEEC